MSLVLFWWVFLLPLDITMTGRRSVSRVRTRRGIATPELSPQRIASEIDLDAVDPERMIQYLRDNGHLGETVLEPPGSGVPPHAAVADASTRAIMNMEAMFQRLMAHASTGLPAPTPSTAPSVTAPTTSTTGKPHLKFPDPPTYEGDPVKLDGWLTQTEMYLRAYDVDLATTRAVEVSTMFLRGKAQDWWTGQYHLMSVGSIPAFTSWQDFVSALTTAFRPVELSRRYIEQMLGISQGKQDMRTYIATFNALRAKIPDAFPESTLSHLFLQGCRPELQRNISLQYPKSLAEYFQHAITLSDLPGQTKAPAAGSRSAGADKAADNSLKSALFCEHCKKSGHVKDRCFQLHPELRKSRADRKKTQH